MTEKKTVKTEVPAKATAQEAVYTIEELAAESQAVFNKPAFVAKAALKKAGKQKYTEKEAKRIVKEFTERKVQ